MLTIAFFYLSYIGNNFNHNNISHTNTKSTLFDMRYKCFKEHVKLEISEQ